MTTCAAILDALRTGPLTEVDLVTRLQEQHEAVDVHAAIERLLRACMVARSDGAIALPSATPAQRRLATAAARIDAALAKPLSRGTFRTVNRLRARIAKLQGIAAGQTSSLGIDDAIARLHK
ncbi:MAG: hypothetical protein HY898_22875 [Deltaproteobacteria bacterium]|nr:hypothetical protein [Deltaproteobacteria bacterium]